MHQGPFAATAFTVANFYRGPADHTWLLVYAGATRDLATGATLNGAVRIYALPDPDGPLTEIGTYSPKHSRTAIKIIRAESTRLILMDGTGHTFAFNLDTDRFTSARIRTTTVGPHR